MDERKEQQKESKIMATVVSGQSLESHFNHIETRLGNNEDRVSELFASQARLESNDAAILQRLDSFSDQMHEINRQVTTPKPFNAVGWITTALFTLSLIGAFAMVVISPMNAQIEKINKYHDIDVGKKLDQAFELGRQTGEIVDLKAEIELIWKAKTAERKEFNARLNQIEIETKQEITDIASRLQWLSTTVERDLKSK